MNEWITIRNARIHNLKHIDVHIPKNKMTVITGVSGSGKSSFAFDILYEEGKRRYLMFSNTQFMVDNIPAFDSISGLSPTVAVEQRITRQSNPRSTVGTRTKINAMLAVLFAAYGIRNPEYDDGLPLAMEHFQKNSPKGMCVRCLGAGKVYKVDEDELFADKSRTLKTLFDGEGTHYYRRIWEFCRDNGLSENQRIDSLSEEQLHIFKYGGGANTRFSGIIPWVIGLYNWSIGKKNWASKLNFVKYISCPKCGGTGLGEQASHTAIGGKTITQLEGMYINDLLSFLREVKLPGTKLLEEILVKLECLADVGLHHISLSRPVPTLSGGEVQRLFLASYIIAEMDSIIFIFDEPTIGLHEIEKQKLIDILQKLVKRGNTVVAVEHDINFMQAADYMIDLGPYAGEYGGECIFQGSYKDFLRCGESMTSPYLSGERSLPVKNRYKPADAKKILKMVDCSVHNLQNITVDIPLGLLVGVAGVSGSGKSSLISDSLVPKLKDILRNRLISDEDENIAGKENALIPLSGMRISGYEHLRKCLIVDQRPIGRSRTSCPATYTGIFDRVRKMFAETTESIEQGFKPGMFSVNAEGKCRKCNGNSVLHYHVGFGNFIDIDCEDCGATGFTPESMAITLDGKNIRDILNMSVTNAMDYFKNKDKIIHRMLFTLDRVGLGYMLLGQKTPTISGGEAQRIKLAKELGKSGSGKNNLYILDEPTTGLSFSDSEKLIQLMQELVDNGNTVIVTEHDPAVLSYCDYIIELGPGGGSGGGYVIAAGTPEEIKNNPKSIIRGFIK